MHQHHAIRGLLVAMLAAPLLAGCGQEPARVASVVSAPQTTTLQSGDLTIRASTMQTSALGAEVASRYGIERADHRVMLLVGLRRGPEAQEVSVPAQVSVTVTDLHGQRHAMPMRELRSGELVDYVGTVDVSLPDTLRFDLSLGLERGKTSTMQFSREFHPR